MRIVVATLYEAVGGSSKVLMAAAEALRAEHAVIVRAPLPGVDSRNQRPLSAAVLDTFRRKLAALPALIRIFFDELAFVGSVRPDIIYVHDEPSLYVYGLIGRLRGVRVVWHVHMREGQGLHRAVRNLLCDAKVFVSRSLATGRQRKPYSIIANPIAIGPVARNRAGRDGRVLGMVGSISRLKNQELGIAVVAHLRRQGVPAGLAIYGNVLESDYGERLSSLVAEMGLTDAVEFRGFVLTEQALSEIDVLLACSSYESFGLAVAEALAAGIPVVATDIAAHREFALVPDSSALVICGADPSAMASAAMAAQPDQDLAVRVRQTFSRERFAAALAEFFRGLAGVHARALPSVDMSR